MRILGWIDAGLGRRWPVAFETCEHSSRTDASARCFITQGESKTNSRRASKACSRVCCRWLSSFGVAAAAFAPGDSPSSSLINGFGYPTQKNRPPHQAEEDKRKGKRPTNPHKTHRTPRKDRPPNGGGSPHIQKSACTAACGSFPLLASLQPCSQPPICPSSF